MNALLASGEVPGLYEGKEFTALMAGCREAAQRDGVLVDSEDELFRRFTSKVLAALLSVWVYAWAGFEPEQQNLLPAFQLCSHEPSFVGS